MPKIRRATDQLVDLDTVEPPVVLLMANPLQDRATANPLQDRATANPRKRNSILHKVKVMANRLRATPMVREVTLLKVSKSIKANCRVLSKVDSTRHGECFLLICLYVMALTDISLVFQASMVRHLSKTALLSKGATQVNLSMVRLHRVVATRSNLLRTLIHILMRSEESSHGICNG